MGEETAPERKTLVEQLANFDEGEVRSIFGSEADARRPLSPTERMLFERMVAGVDDFRSLLRKGLRARSPKAPEISAESVEVLTDLAAQMDDVVFGEKSAAKFVAKVQGRNDRLKRRRWADAVRDALDPSMLEIVEQHAAFKGLEEWPATRLAFQTRAEMLKGRLEEICKEAIALDVEWLTNQLHCSHEKLPPTYDTEKKIRDRLKEKAILDAGSTRVSSSALEPPGLCAAIASKCEALDMPNKDARKRKDDRKRFEEFF